MLKLPRWPLLCLSLLLLAGAVPPLDPGRAAGVYILDRRSGKTLLMVLPTQELAVLSSTGETFLGVEALSARFLPDGQIAFIDPNLALRRFGVDVKKGTDGVSTVAIPGAPVSVFMRCSAGYAYIAAGLDRSAIDPENLLPPGSKWLAGDGRDAGTDQRAATRGPNGAALQPPAQ